jgi:hypothetical protein
MNPLLFETWNVVTYVKAEDSIFTEIITHLLEYSKSLADSIEEMLIPILLVFNVSEKPINI